VRNRDDTLEAGRRKCNKFNVRVIFSINTRIINRVSSDRFLTPFHSMNKDPFTAIIIPYTFNINKSLVTDSIQSHPQCRDDKHCTRA